jgi:hypothetical protein
MMPPLAPVLPLVPLVPLLPVVVVVVVVVAPPLALAPLVPVAGTLLPVFFEPLEPLVPVAAPVPVPVSRVEGAELHPIETARLATATAAVREKMVIVFIGWLLPTGVCSNSVIAAIEPGSGQR